MNLRAVALQLRIFLRQLLVNSTGHFGRGAFRRGTLIQFPPAEIVFRFLIQRLTPLQSLTRLFSGIALEYPLNLTAVR